MFAIITLACCLAALTLFGVAAWTDRCHRRIANRISLAIVALFAIWLATGYLLEDRFVVPWSSHLLAATGVFIVSYGLWMARLFGGGDVKILTAVALWAGTGGLAPMILLVTLSGAVMAVVLLLLSHFLPHTAQLVFGPAPALAHTGQEPPEPPSPGARPTLPYGVAIVIGGVWVMTQTMLQFGTP